MGQILLPKQYHPDFATPGKKPIGPAEIDWTDPISVGLKYYIVFNGAEAIDLVSNKPLIPSSTPTQRIITNRGRASDLNGTDFFTLPHSSNIALDGPITLLWSGVIDTGSAFRHFAGKHSGGGGTNNPFDFRTNNFSTPLVETVRANSGLAIHQGPAVPLGKFHILTFTQDGLIENAGAYFLDGVKSTSSLSGSGTGAPSTNTEDVRFGRRSDGAVQMDGAHFVCAAWNRELADVENIRISRDLTSVLKPATAQIYNFPSAAGSDINGTLSVTLDDMTVAGTGEVPITGTLASTLDDLTVVGTGEIPIGGTLSTTLDDLTVSGTGVVVSGATGTLAVTLDDVSVVGTGTVAVEGTTSVTLDDLTVVGTAEAAVAGTLSSTLDDLTVSGTGAVGTFSVGILDVTLDDVTAVGTGVVAVEGTSSITLDDLTVSGTSTVDVVGTLSSALDDLIVSATGTGLALPLIDGDASKLINANGGSLDLYFNGTDYFEVA
jgi:hypothetical protein